jgi:hypothetical protein
MMPVKDSHTRIKPLALASDHGRYITVTPQRTPVSVEEWPSHVDVIGYEFVTASLPKRLQERNNQPRLWRE